MIDDHHNILKQVLHVEQQVVKRRVKRDFSLPTDPLWNAEWYLVRLFWQ